MTHSPQLTQPRSEPPFEPPFKRRCALAYGSLAAGWAIGVVIVGLALWTLAAANQIDRPVWAEAVVIAAASGVIGAAAMLPGLLALAKTNRSQGRTAGSRRVAADRWSGISAAVMTGTAIRLVGTVALFLTCRYQMASTTEMIVAMTIGWYVLLTSIEVIVLGRVLLDAAGKPRRLVISTPLKV